MLIFVVLKHEKVKRTFKINGLRKPIPNFPTFCSRSLHSNKASPVEVNSSLSNELCFRQQESHAVP